MCMCNILVNAQKCNCVEIVPRKSHLKVPGGLKASKLSQLGHFRFHCLFEEGYFSSMDLEIGVRVCLREVSAYVRL